MYEMQAGNLRRHVSLLHPPDVTSRTVFRCPHCTCVFSAVQPLQVHIRKRHPEDSTTTDTSGGLSVVNTAEKTDGDIGQEESSKAYCSAQKVQRCRRLVCCSICGRAFGNSSDLMHHYRVHNGIRPYSCDNCDSSFTSRSSTKTHTGLHVQNDNASFISCSLSSSPYIKK
ncbi:hypothetical protein AB6A40_011509 [Gnathostoma spinigerum]|uniref:C2H2-type domain-containing protein n=1 Tax=Gnathostoma spinigerum TaxID=75299 RepID=A0ABD6EXX0_9BILA